MSIKKRKRIRKEITCKCDSYRFPHRLGGGNCTGAVWAEFMFHHLNEKCVTCNCRNEHEQYCEVAEGQEDIAECEKYADILHYVGYGADGAYPQSLEEMISDYESHFEDRYRDEDTDKHDDRAIAPEHHELKDDSEYPF